MNYSRSFVKHRNDSNPPNRSVEIIETENKKSRDYPEASLIIPTTDGYRDGHLPALFKQLKNQRYQNFEIIVVQGDSRQGRAINIGADIARGGYLLTLDDDTSLTDETSIERLVNAAKKDASIGMAGGINVIPGQASFFVKLVMSQLPRRTTPDVDEITQSDLAEHPLLLLRKDVFKKVGGENELLPRGLDPYLRSEFRKAGYQVVVVPKAYYSHLPPANLRKLVKQFYRNGKMSAYCNKFFPQWLVETPNRHVDKFVEQRPFPYRVVRHLVNLAANCILGHWIYLTVYLAYGLGFGWGWIQYKNTDQV